MSASGAEGEAPRVSIIVTCFNSGATLRSTVESIDADGAEPIELVVVDDGSTDDRTRGVLGSLEDSGIRVIRQVNVGQAAATMAGLAATSAAYVMRFDSDDLMEPGAVAALADALDANEQASAVWGDVQTFGTTTFVIPTALGLDPWLITYTNCVLGSGVLFRRSALLETGGWQLSTGFEDWDLWMALAERGHSALHIDRVVFRYRRDGTGRNARADPHVNEYFETLRSRHPALFRARRSNRRSSNLPLPVKLAVPAIEALPRISRLTKIQLSELAARIFWTGGIRRTAPMVRQAIALRLGGGR
jgi:glycosyltransferase involved in cell wall biosynthesis